MAFSVGVLSLFKGDKPPPRGAEGTEMRQNAEAAITGRHPATGERLDGVHYLQVLRRVKLDNRQLVENVGRVLACAIHALLMERRETPTHRYYLEGLRWDWGLRERTGAETLSEIDSAMPEEIRRALPPATCESYSNCTRRELERTFTLAEQHGDSVVRGVTDSYHADRAQTIALEVQADRGFPHPPTIWTPQNILSEWRTACATHRPQPAEIFLMDAIEAAAPEESTLKRERRWERLVLTPLHRLSRTLELTLRQRGVHFDLEAWLAGKVRR